MATTLSYIFYFFGSLYYLKKEFNIFASFKTIIKPIIASLIMAAVILFTKNIIGDMNLFTGAFIVLLGIAAYFISLFIIKGFSKDDLSLALSLIKNKEKTTKSKAPTVLTQIGEENPVKI